MPVFQHEQPWKDFMEDTYSQTEGNTYSTRRLDDSSLEDYLFYLSEIGRMCVLKI